MADRRDHFEEPWRVRGDTLITANDAFIATTLMLSSFRVYLRRPDHGYHRATGNILNVILY